MNSKIYNKISYIKERYKDSHRLALFYKETSSSVIFMQYFNSENLENIRQYLLDHLFVSILLDLYSRRGWYLKLRNI